MKLAALLIAGRHANATLIGVPDVEHLIRRVRDAGAGHAVILSERVTADLMASVGRLRREGLSLGLARTPNEMVEMIHPDERVLMIPDDLIIAPKQLRKLSTARVSTLLALPDDAETATFERIDATSRWTGALLTDGQMLRATAAMVGDWDFASTLMRSATQNGAERLMTTPDTLMAIDVEANRADTMAILLAQVTLMPEGWAGRTMIDPSARWLGRLAAAQAIEARWLSLGGLLLLGGALLSALAGWILASLALLILGELVQRTGLVVADAGKAVTAWQRWEKPMRRLTASVVGLAAGTTLFFRTLQWGCVVLGVAMVGAHMLLRRLAPDPDRWRSDPAGLALIALIAASAGLPVIGLLIGAIVAVADLSRAIVRKAGLVSS